MKTKSPLFAQLTETASGIVKRAANLKSTTPESITFLCGWFDCHWGAYWHVDPKKLLLTPAFSWNNDSLRAEKLRANTDSRSLTISEGTAGHIWRTGTPVCTDNIVRDMSLTRSLDASEVGLRGGIWSPIRTEEMTLGVVELLGRHYWSCDDRFLGELGLFGLALGSVSARK